MIAETPGFINKAIKEIPTFSKIIKTLNMLADKYEYEILPRYGFNLFRVELRKDWLTRYIKAYLVNTGLLYRASLPRIFIKSGYVYRPDELSDEFFKAPKAIIRVIPIHERIESLEEDEEDENLSYTEAIGKILFVLEPEEEMELAEEQLKGHDAILQRFIEIHGMQKFKELRDLFTHYKYLGTQIYRYLLLIYNRRNREYYIGDIIEKVHVWIHKVKRFRRYSEPNYIAVGFYKIRR